MSATGRGAKRAKLDDYSTPDEPIDAILEVLLPCLDVISDRPLLRILEPAAGRGAIVKRLQQIPGIDPRRIAAIEIDPDRAEICRRFCSIIERDFIRDGGPWPDPGQGLRWSNSLDLIITNPPYIRREKYRGPKKGRKWVTHDAALEFAQRSLELLRPGGYLALLLRVNWLEGVKKNPRYHFLRETRPTAYVLPRRPKFGTLKGSDACAYAWIVWRKGHPLGGLEFLEDKRPDKPKKSPSEVRRRGNKKGDVRDPRRRTPAARALPETSP